MFLLWIIQIYLTNMGTDTILETQITVNEADKAATKCIKGIFDMYRMLIVDDEKMSETVSYICSKIAAFH